ncbi:MAG: 2,3-bisphosphoglycerate-independent phosphoglycerate mutase [Gammaproteobacteria bacterium]
MIEYITMSALAHKPLLLLILDGWGHREDATYNAIARAHTPHWDKLIAQYPHGTLSCAGKVVGLPEGQMGNSEVGHMHMGAGRSVPQDLTRIDEAIASGEFRHNKVFTTLLETLQQSGKTLHLLGLLSPGGVHSHENHLLALATLAHEAGVKTAIHGILDGRDTPPQSALAYVKTLEKAIASFPSVTISSLIGRYYAMDRDNRWERTEAAFQLYTTGHSLYQANSATQAIIEAYERGETDEFIKATVIHPSTANPTTLHPGDGLCFMNFRADRARQLSYAFTEKNFTHFNRQALPPLSQFVTLTEYASNLDATVAFPPFVIQQPLGEILSLRGYKQCRIAETEKYAHVTFFFNGGRETAFHNETRILVPSPSVATYDLQPSMSVEIVTEHLISMIKNQEQDVIICNFANADMVGHTGNFDATVQAIEAIDSCLGKLIVALQAVQGEMLITADHGNAELMYNPNTQQAHTAHTTEKVPLVYMGRCAQFTGEKGTLTDIAPTVLYLLNEQIPSVMTGKPMFTLNDK